MFNFLIITIMNTGILFIYRGTDFVIFFTTVLILAFFIIMVYVCSYKMRKQIYQKMKEDLQKVFKTEKLPKAGKKDNLQAEKISSGAAETSAQEAETSAQEAETSAQEVETSAQEAETSAQEEKVSSGAAEYAEKTEISEKKILLNSKPEINSKDGKSPIKSQQQKTSKGELKRLAKTEKKKAKKLQKGMLARKNELQRQKAELENMAFNACDALFLEKIKLFSDEDLKTIQSKVIEQVQICLKNSKLSTKQFDNLKRKLLDFRQAAADYLFALKTEDKATIHSRNDYMLLCLKWLHDCHKKVQNSL